MRPSSTVISLAFALVALTSAEPADAGQSTQPARTGREVYESICIACHGPDGRAGVNLELEKFAQPPDFTDCAFAAREPDRGFLAVAHGGGPARGFSPLMPPWGSTVSEGELRAAVEHLRTFCKDDRWPRGELNLPRPLVTAKAFPEDEAVIGTSATSGNVVTKIFYERRFGALNQFEAVVPIASVESESGEWPTGIGDIAIEYKRVLTHSLRRGNIASVTAEFVLPTGSEAKGTGGETGAFEPFVTFGQVLPRDGFIQAQAGFAIPFKREHDDELFWRVAIGKSFEPSQFGRVWSPMLEILAARALVSDGAIEWDLVPGMQVTLNRRQHVRIAGGVRMPVTQTDTRSNSVVFYLLWDWYEGGFFQGW